jgi:hypothetical protein
MRTVFSEISRILLYLKVYVAKSINSNLTYNDNSGHLNKIKDRVPLPETIAF